MAPSPIRNVLRAPRGYASAEAASFIAQLDDLTERMVMDLRGMSVRELEWQPAPGRNSIGMLLAHLALVEVSWLGGPASRQTLVNFPRVVGIGVDDDGIPAAPGSRHPQALRGKRLAFYLGLFKKSRPYVRRIAKRFTPSEVEEPLTRMWRSQKRVHVYNRRWIFYHVLEHLAGHYGQILLLKELMREPKAPRSKPPVARGRARVAARKRRSAS